MRKAKGTIGKTWASEMRVPSLLAVDRTKFLESEFGAGLMVGVGGSGLAIALSENPTNWLFVGASVVSSLGGLLIFFMVKAASREKA